MTDTKLPRRKLTDATHTASLRKGYYDKLAALYREFDNQLQPGLQRMIDRNPESGYIREFSDKINTTSDVTIYAGAPKIIDQNMKLSYSSGKTRAVSNPRLKNTIKIDPSLSYYDMSIIEDLKNRNLGLVTKLTEDIKADIIRIMTDDLKQGKGTLDISRDISNQITDISKARAKTIARTEIAYSYNTAIGNTYKRAGIEKWQWLATLGFKCCDECIARHGQIYEWIDEQPPLHPNCFCTIYPIIETGE